jgi:hypothetical protein
MNLIPEPPPPGEDSAPWTYYPTPGLTEFAQAASGPVRGIYVPGNGLGFYYAVIGSGVYAISQTTQTMTYIGSIGSSSGPVCMQDNRIVMVIVDGSTNGWYVTLSDNTLTQISDSAFFGATQVVFLDTFLVFNKVNSNQWYSSPSNYAGNSTPFDSLYIATKSTYPDNIVALASINQLIWIIGAQTTELWYDAGSADFPFGRVPEVLIHHGCVASYSIATADGGVFWLSQDLQGRNMVLHGAGYQAKRISTYPIEYAISKYGKVSDAIGMTYSQAGHVFYVLTFPTASKTWVYDLTTDQWHERCSLDASGNEQRHRMNCVAPNGQFIVAGDFENGTLYHLDPGAYTDNGTPIKRQRAFPHMMGNANRVFHRRFVADMGIVDDPNDNLSLDWSDDRGNTFGSPITMAMVNTQGMGFAWWRLGLSRDRVYRLTWTAPIEIALQGAWIEADAGTS